MKGSWRLAIVTLISLWHQVLCHFYHTPSRITVRALDSTNANNTYFGFSIAYQESPLPRLIIGAPKHGVDGKVYVCNIKQIDDNTILCSPVDINIKELAKSTKSVPPEEHFHLGARIISTEDYFFTCAPNWKTAKLKTPSGIINENQIGTCFYYNGTVHIYQGILEQRIKRIMKPLHSSCTGWNMLADHTNDLLLISAPAANTGYMYYLPLRRPFENVKSQSLSSKDSLDYTYNVGFGLAAGNFFGNETSYVYSYLTKYYFGMIRFAKYTQGKFKNQLTNIINKNIGFMFGTELHSVDIDRDGFVELIVGSPTWYSKQETGAVCIYQFKEMVHVELIFTILGDNDGDFFGASVASYDLDGDQYPELFISAPFKDNRGAVYILSGARVYDSIFKFKSTEISVSQLKETQMILSKEHRMFGFKINIIPDIDENGCNELAIGSPGHDFVFLYKCLPRINVTMTTNIIGPKIISVLKTVFEMNVTLIIEYPSKPASISSKLLVTNSIINIDNINYDSAIVREPTFELDLSKKDTMISKNITVKLLNNEPGSYSFTSQVKLHSETEELLKSKDFKNTWAVLGSSSSRVSSTRVDRKCIGVECRPNLSVNFTWSGRNPYQLGSSHAESVKININNEGNNTYKACVRIKIGGASVSRTDCSGDGSNYICVLRSPLRRFQQQTFDFTLDMNNMTNANEELNLEAELYEKCDDFSNYTIQKFHIKYALKNDLIMLLGSSSTRYITDVQLLDKKIKTINDSQEYSILNNGTVKWLNMPVIIYINKYDFVDEYQVSVPGTCSKHENETSFRYDCAITLNGLEGKKIIVVAAMNKKKLEKRFKEANLTMFSSIDISFKQKRLTKTVVFQKELSFANNCYLIITLAVLLSLLILTIVVYFLYKNNFFKRKEKERLEDLRESVRRKSMRRGTTASTDPGHENLEGVELDVIEDPFEDPPIPVANDLTELVPS